MSTRKRRPTGGIMDRRQFLRLVGLGGGGLVVGSGGGVGPPANPTPPTQTTSPRGAKNTP